MTISRYVGRIANGTSLEDLREFIRGKDVDVVTLEQLSTRHDLFQSYKLVVKKSDLQKIENEDFWPSGIIVRRYFSPRGQTNDGESREPRLD